jgi:hypothetical protein
VLNKARGAKQAGIAGLGSPAVGLGDADGDADAVGPALALTPGVGDALALTPGLGEDEVAVCGQTAPGKTWNRPVEPSELCST